MISDERLKMRKGNAKLIKKQQKYKRYRKIKQVSMNSLQVKKNYFLMKVEYENNY